MGTATAQPARIVLIRHAEKPADEEDPHLTDLGRQRARQLGAWLKGDPELAANLPTALYAAKPSRRGRGVRPLETLQPLAAELKLQVRTPWEAEDYSRLANELLRDTSLKGQTVLVCWTHSELPDFAAALGVKPKPRDWKAKDYRSVYLITLSEGKANLSTKRQPEIPARPKP
jgi:phosphohistidine phosphatase SixA